MWSVTDEDILTEELLNPIGQLVSVTACHSHFTYWSLLVLLQIQLSTTNDISRSNDSFLSGRQTNDKVGHFRLPIKSANKNLSSVMQKSAEFVCH